MTTNPTALPDTNPPLNPTQSGSSKADLPKTDLPKTDLPKAGSQKPDSKKTEPRRKGTRSWMLTVMVLFAIVFAWLPVLDNFTSAYLNDGIGQAGITFATARAIDAMISMIQTSSLSLPFFSIDLGQMLDPINDMVEDFSQVMTWVLGSLILQKVLFEIASKDIINWLLTISAIIALVALWSTVFAHKSKQLLIKGFVLLFSLRFIVLFSLLLNSVVNSLFLEPLMEQNQQRLEVSSDKMMELQKSLMGLDYQTQMDATKEKLIVVTQQHANLTEQELQYQPKIDQLNQQIKAKKESLNWFETDDELKGYQRELAPLVLERKKLASQISSVEKEIKNLNERQVKIQQKLDGDDIYRPNLMDDIELIDKTSTLLSSSEFWDEVEASSKTLIDEMIEAMVYFILKVILMPLLFLWLTKTWLLNFYRMFGLDEEIDKNLNNSQA